ncbi:MAG: hypothetical protein ABSA93_31400, partial [Streptosporangiaceae bacterium]
MPTSLETGFTPGWNSFFQVVSGTKPPLLNALGANNAQTSAYNVADRVAQLVETLNSAIDRALSQMDTQVSPALIKSLAAYTYEPPYLLPTMEAQLRALGDYAADTGKEAVAMRVQAMIIMVQLMEELLQQAVVAIFDPIQAIEDTLELYAIGRFLLRILRSDLFKAIIEPTVANTLQQVIMNAMTQLVLIKMGIQPGWSWSSFGSAFAIGALGGALAPAIAKLDHYLGGAFGGLFTKLLDGVGAPDLAKLGAGAGEKFAELIGAGVHNDLHLFLYTLMTTGATNGWDLGTFTNGMAQALVGMGGRGVGLALKPSINDTKPIDLTGVLNDSGLLTTAGLNAVTQSGLDTSGPETKALDDDTEAETTPPADGELAPDDGTGKVNVTVPTVNVPSTHVDTPVLNVKVPSADDESAALNVTTPALNVETSALDDETPALSVETPALDVETPALNVKMPALDVQTPARDVETSALDVETPARDVNMPAVVQTPSREAETPPLNVETPASRVTEPLTTEDVPSATPQVLTSVVEKSPAPETNGPEPATDPLVLALRMNGVPLGQATAIKLAWRYTPPGSKEPSPLIPYTGSPADHPDNKDAISNPIMVAIRKGTFGMVRPDGSFAPGDIKAVMRGLPVGSGTRAVPAAQSLELPPADPEVKEQPAALPDSQSALLDLAAGGKGDATSLPPVGDADPSASLPDSQSALLDLAAGGKGDAGSLPKTPLDPNGGTLPDRPTTPKVPDHPGADSDHLDGTSDRPGKQPDSSVPPVTPARPPAKSAIDQHQTIPPGGHASDRQVPPVHGRPVEPSVKPGGAAPRTVQEVISKAGTDWTRNANGQYVAEHPALLVSRPGPGTREPFEIPAGSLASLDGSGEIALVVRPDGVTYNQDLEGVWSGPREYRDLNDPAAAQGDLAAEKLSKRVLLKLAEKPSDGKRVLRLPGRGRVARLPAGSEMVTDKAAGGRPVAYRQEVDAKGRRLKEPVTYVRDGDGTWKKTEDPVDGPSYQAWQAAGNQHIKAARTLWNIASRPDLAELTTKQLAELLNGSDDDKFAATYEAIRRVEKKTLRWTQVAAAHDMADGKVVNVDAGEGKSLMFLVEVARQALRPGVDAVQFMPSTSITHLANREYERYVQVLGSLGFAIHRMNPDKPPSEPVAGQPTIYIGTLEDLAFTYLKTKLLPGQRAEGKTNIVARVDEVDLLKYDNSHYIYSDGPTGRADDDTTRLVEWARDTLQDEVSKKEGGLTEADFGLEKGRGGPAKLTPEGLAKIGPLSPERERALNRAASARWEYIENIHYAVYGGEIAIINQATHALGTNKKTGRSSRWYDGVAQALEAKHNLTIRTDSKAIGPDNSVTAKDLFHMDVYSSVTGASGTAIGHEGVFAEHNLPSQVSAIQRYYVNRLNVQPDVVTRDQEEKVATIAAHTTQAWAGGVGRPQIILAHRNDLVSTIARGLRESGLRPTVIDAHWMLRQGPGVEEALQRVLGREYRPGEVLVINMQGARGADYIMSALAKARGGPIIRVTAHSEISPAVDIQARARGGRSGDEADAVFYPSLDDDLFSRSHIPFVPQVVTRYNTARAKADTPVATPAARSALVRAENTIRQLIPFLQTAVARGSGITTPALSAPLRPVAAARLSRFNGRPSRTQGRTQPYSRARRGGPVRLQGRSARVQRGSLVMSPAVRGIG